MGPDSIPPRHSALGRRPDLCGPVASKHLEKAASSPSCCQLRVVPARSVLLSTGGAICGQKNLQLSKYVADRRLGRGRPSPPAPRPAPTPAVRLRSAAPTVPHAHTGHARPCAARPPSSPFASCRSPRHSSSAHRIEGMVGQTDFLGLQFRSISTIPVSLYEFVDALRAQDHAQTLKWTRVLIWRSHEYSSYSAP